MEILKILFGLTVWLFSIFGFAIGEIHVCEKYKYVYGFAAGTLCLTILNYVFQNM